MDGKNNSEKNITIILTLEECKTLQIICKEVLGNYRWKTNRKRALVLNKILDKIEKVEK